jgi:hypothetical protein
MWMIFLLTRQLRLRGCKKMAVFGKRASRDERMAKDA